MIETRQDHNILIKKTEDNQERNTDNKSLNINQNKIDNKELMTEHKIIMIAMTEKKILMQEIIKENKDQRLSLVANKVNQINTEVNKIKEPGDIIEIIVFNFKDKITIFKGSCNNPNKLKIMFMLDEELH